MSTILLLPTFGRVASSVPDLANFCHFDRSLKNFGQFESVH